MLQGRMHVASRRGITTRLRHRRARWLRWFAPWGFFWGCEVALVHAQPREPTSQPTSQPAETQSKQSSEKTAPRQYYRSRSLGATPAPDPPRYVINGEELAKWLPVKDRAPLNWLDLGVEQNTRYEHRRNYYPAGNRSDNRFLMRNRAYLGIREIVDPLRFGIEFQDARAFGNDFPEINQDVDEADLQQAFGELYFRDAFGPAQPLSLRAGRMSFDLVNRRLIARNGFRNSTNAFDGLRLRAGDESTRWEANVIALQPVERRVRQRDRTDEERWLIGATAAYRGFDPGIILKPYYFVFDEDRKGFNVYDREIHTVGMNLFGLLGDSGFDYDVDVAWQFGKSLRRNHRAFGAHAELGYLFSHDWHPRLSAFVDYTSGDRHPFDRVNERFSRLFGASHSFVAPTDMFVWENLIQPGVMLNLKPIDKLMVNASYRAYWMASDSDVWAPNNLRARYGNQGDFIGHGLDVFAVLQVTRQLAIEIGYAHLTVGPFIENTSPRPDDSDFFYVQTTLRF